MNIRRVYTEPYLVVDLSLDEANQIFCALAENSDLPKDVEQFRLCLLSHLESLGVEGY
jgi:hypothetical protein